MSFSSPESSQPANIHIDTDGVRHINLTGSDVHAAFCPPIREEFTTDEQTLMYPLHPSQEFAHVRQDWIEAHNARDLQKSNRASRQAALLVDAFGRRFGIYPIKPLAAETAVGPHYRQDSIGTVG